MKALTWSTKLAIAIIFAMAATIVLMPGLAGLTTIEQGGAISWGIIAILTILIAFGPSIRRAFGRGFIALGCAFFLLPIGTMVLSGRVSSENATAAAAAGVDESAALIGGAIAGTAMTGVAGFVGFFLGAICLTIGLILALGGRREVIIVHQAPNVAERPEPTVKRP